jgi:hypothetical protein
MDESLERAHLYRLLSRLRTDALNARQGAGADASGRELKVRFRP